MGGKKKTGKNSNGSKALSITSLHLYVSAYLVLAQQGVSASPHSIPHFGGLWMLSTLCCSKELDITSK